jgi:hypothetical protein
MGLTSKSIAVEENVGRLVQIEEPWRVRIFHKLSFLSTAQATDTPNEIE